MALGPLLLFMSFTTLAAFVQATFGFGFAIVAVPVLSLIDPAWAPVPQLYAQVLLAFLIYYPEREHADWRGVGWTTLGRIPGTLAAAGLLLIATQSVLDLVVGAIVLVAVVVVAYSPALPRSRPAEFIAGAASSAGAVLAAIGGPPVALLYRQEPGPVVRSTLSLIAGVGIVMAIAMRAAVTPFDWVEFKLAMISLPAVAIGVFFARFAKHRVEGKILRTAVLVLCAAGAISLLARGMST